MRRHLRRPRPGYTLIEMVMVIGAVSIVIGLCAAVLSGLFKLDRAGRVAVNDATTLARLARQFRQDVRASSAARPLEAKPPGLGSGLELSGGDAPTVVYRLEGPWLHREERRGDGVKSREAYPAERLGPVSFGAEGRRAWVVLSRRPGEGNRLQKPEVRIEARIGKDREVGQVTGARK